MPEYDWRHLFREEKIALIKKHGQSGTAKLTGTTSSAVGGFMSRNAAALGISRANPERTRTRRPAMALRDPHSEAALTERWADRQRPGRQVYVAKTTGKPGNRWTPEMKHQLAVDWKRGLSVKKIAIKLHVGENAVKKQRITQKLAERRPRRAKFRQVVHISLDPEEYLALRDGAERRGSSMTDYMAYLIQRDAGKIL